MTSAEAQKLDHGLYAIYWKMGGFSLASVGSTYSGKRWYAPTNWVGFKPSERNTPATDWIRVERVELLFSMTWVGGDRYDITRHENGVEGDK